MLVWSTLLALFITWPTPLSLNAQFLGAESGDALKHLWTLWWFRHAVLIEHELPLYTLSANYPVGLELFPIEPLNGVIACILGFIPIVAAGNLIAILNLIALGMAGAYFGKSLCDDRLAGFVCGTVLQGSSFATFTLVAGVGELQHLWLLPLGLGLLVRLQRQQKLQDALIVGLYIAFTTICCIYYGFFLSIALTVICFVHLLVSARSAATSTPPGPTVRVLLGRYAFTTAIAAVTTLPLIALFQNNYPNDKTAEGSSIVKYVVKTYGQPIVDPPDARLTLNQLFTSGPHLQKTEPQPPEDPAALARNSPEPRDKVTEPVTKPGEPEAENQRHEVNPKHNNVEVPKAIDTSPKTSVYSGGRYLGIPLLCFAILGIIRKPKESAPLACAAVVATVLACGSQLTPTSSALLGGYTGALPFFYLNRVLETLVGPIHFPARFLSITIVCLAGCASLAVSRKYWVYAVLGTLLFLVDVQANQGLTRPLPTVALKNYQALKLLERDDAPTVDLAMAWQANEENRNQAIAAQIFHAQKSQSVPIERLDEFHREGHTLVADLPLVQALKPAYIGYGAQLEDVDSTGDLKTLYDAGFRRLQVLGTGTNQHISASLRSSLTTLVGEPLVTASDVAVWRIPAPHELPLQSTGANAGESTPNSQ